MISSIIRTHPRFVRTREVNQSHYLPLHSHATLSIFIESLSPYVVSLCYESFVLDVRSVEVSRYTSCCIGKGKSSPFQEVTTLGICANF